jgi:hypothetical protein
MNDAVIRFETSYRSVRRLAVVCSLLLASACGGGGGGGGGPPAPPAEAAAWVKYWNQVAIDASGRSHTQAYREQLGPGRSSRAVAIVQIAVFDAVNAILGGYESYTGLAPASPDASLKTAIAHAAYDTLIELFPKQVEFTDTALDEFLAGVADDDSKDAGTEVGRAAARAILDLRADDGSDHAEPVIGVDFFPRNEVGAWGMDPISQIGVALGARWNEVTPFVMSSAEEFRIPPPPNLLSAEYTTAFNEIVRLGGDGDTTPTERTEDQTMIGIYWAYDGTPSLCAPPRLYNQVAVEIATQRGTGVLELARLLALVNVSMADSGIAIWESKFYYQLWRPVTGVRAEDGNPDTANDPTFTPLGAPASNIAGVDFTPPFPAYPSGHAGFGGTLFQTLRRFYGTDDIPFTFTSDELNGVTTDWEGILRPLLPRSYANLSEAEEENGQSRIYLGIHWAFDKTEGIAQGRRVADLVFDTVFRPAS